MISSLQGTVEGLGVNWAIINVNGIGFQVMMPTSDLASLGGTGQRVKVYTHFHLREDNASLFGFLTTDGLSLFETIITVSGIGPRTALAMLSALSAEKLAAAIVTGNRDVLTEIPGIGKKTADRIILELKDKIGTDWISTPAMQLAAENKDVVAALVGLGYSAAEATRAVASLPPDSTLTLEDKIKLALASFGK